MNNVICYCQIKKENVSLDLGMLLTGKNVYIGVFDLTRIEANVFYIVAKSDKCFHLRHCQLFVKT